MMAANGTVAPPSPAPASAGPPSVEPIFGPLLIGVCVNCIFYGILILQVFFYYVTYKKDTNWIRCFVLYLFAVETINIGCNIATIYEPLVIRYGTPAALTFFPILITATPTTNVAISTPVQIFTAWRIVIITQNKIVGLIICLLSLLSLGFATYTASIITTVREFIKKGDTVKPATVWFVASFCADLLITATLYFSLARRRTGFNRSTDLVINRIIRLTLQTGLLTLLFAVAETISFIVSPDTTANFALDFPLSKLYTNALLSTLNARMSWRRLANSEDRCVEDDDNILFGKADDLGTLQFRSAQSQQVSAIHSPPLSPVEMTNTSTSLSNTVTHELNTRPHPHLSIPIPDIGHRPPILLRLGGGAGAGEEGSDVTGSPNSPQIDKEPQVVLEDELKNRWSPTPYKSDPCAHT